MDTRRDATFLPLYTLPGKNNAPITLQGMIYRKNLGYVNAAGVRVYVGDEIYYRLPWAYLTLAEVENMKGGDVAKYINMVRRRAYGDDYDANVHGYKNGSFTENELAILAEKDKEFVCEGQRWWDIRRMTLTKGGDPLVFFKESSIDGLAPILDKASQAYKVLWPIDVATLNKDPKLEQTPGY